MIQINKPFKRLREKFIEAWRLKKPISLKSQKERLFKPKFFFRLEENKIGFPLSRNRFFKGKNPPDKNQALGFLNKRGQGLVEYLVLVALMGVATIGIIRTLNQTVKSRFANAVFALQGKNQKATTHNMKKEEYQRSDLSNFMSGAASSDKKKRKRKKQFLFKE